MKHHTLIVAGIIVGLTIGLLSIAAGGSARGGFVQQEVRIGTYDNRAITVAYVTSKFNPVKEKMQAYEKAKVAGDEATMRELEAWGEAHQKMLHFQGFGRVPVDDLLEPVHDKLAEVAARHNLAAIVMACDYRGEEVEMVDVTDELVALYQPNEATLKMVKNVREARPVPLTDLTEPPPAD